MDAIGIGAFVLAKRIVASESECSASGTSSDEELLFCLKKIKKIKHTYIESYVTQVVSYYDDIDFQSHFRLTREVIEKLLVEWQLQPVAVSAGMPPVKPVVCLLLTLWILANQESFRGTADRFGFSRGHAHNIFIKMIK
ncbi:hypothetical protein NQ315_014535 [Exocentrus adspersus]|uniref:Transposase Helix-turn-helix domain-containing protein n=1 Tax=Exocentrus adspersus TaxID=1586481 RepID=A0AAV8VKL4_9CUCU|nr:hypothetical protein NQ315_014535 [Exocentrus adspersus]